jgi:hypothetical protein
MDVFVSVGTVANAEQEAFVTAVEERLTIEGLTPHTLNRNTYSVDAPLKAVTELLDTCRGTVVIALERSYFPQGIDKRGGPQERAISDVRIPTPWNQIEASMSYSRGLPLFVIVEETLRSDGLLEDGYDWSVHRLKAVPESLNTRQFNGMLASWKTKITAANGASAKVTGLEELSLPDLVKRLPAGKLWRLGTGVGGAAGAIFGCGFWIGTVLGHHG